MQPHAQALPEAKAYAVIASCQRVEFARPPAVLHAVHSELPRSLMERLMLMLAIGKLLPGVDCADTDGTLKGIRWDTPDVTPPTQAEVDAAIADLQAEPTPAEKLARFGITKDDLKTLLGLK